MRTSIAKWGNSLAVRIPRDVIERANLREGAAVDVTAKAGTLVVAAARPRYRLADLLVKETRGRRHGEVDWGPARGKEVW
jgi:antitoxin MazE